MGRLATQHGADAKNGTVIKRQDVRGAQFLIDEDRGLGHLPAIALVAGKNGKDPTSNIDNVSGPLSEQPILKGRIDAGKPDDLFTPDRFSADAFAGNPGLDGRDEIGVTQTADMGVKDLAIMSVDAVSGPRNRKADLVLGPRREPL